MSSASHKESVQSDCAVSHAPLPISQGISAVTLPFPQVQYHQNRERKPVGTYSELWKFARKYVSTARKMPSKRPQLPTPEWMNDALPERPDNNNAQAKLAHIDFQLRVEWSKERCGERVFWDERREGKRHRRETRVD